VGDDIRLVRAAIDLGITVFDTADAYGAGASEYVLGRAVKGRREDVVIGTKGGFTFRSRSRAEQWARRWAKPAVDAIRRPRGAVAPQPAQYDHQDFSPRHLREAVRGSLRRLRTDRIDVYQLHAPPHVLPDLVEQLSDLVAIGEVGRFGVGAQTADAADGWILVPGISMVQVPFGILDPEAASTTLPLAREHGREVWARGVFGGGLLALAERDPGALAGDPKWEPIQALRRTAAAAGLDSYQLALGFLRAHPDVSTVLIGSTSVEHLERNARLFDEPPLDERLLRAAVESCAAASSIEERG
jgi:aryl-alcohol dehydrogenase-like predicted oxidoreductase